MPDRSISLREFEAADAELLGAWLTAAGLGVPPWVEPAVWARRLVADPRISCRAASRGGRVLGFCRLDVAPDRAAELTVVVSPAHRRRGIGRALIDDAVDQARELGLRRLTALVQPENAVGLAFFGEADFVEVRPTVSGFVNLARIVHRAHRVPPLEIQP